MTNLDPRIPRAFRSATEQDPFAPVDPSDAPGAPDAPVHCSKHDWRRCTTTRVVAVLALLLAIGFAAFRNL